MPNAPNFSLGPMVGSSCDTLTSARGPDDLESPVFNLVYHSELQSALLNVSKLIGANVKIYLTDISGRILFVEEGKTIAGYFTKNIPMDNFAAGIYLLMTFALIGVFKLAERHFLAYLGPRKN